MSSQNLRKLHKSFYTRGAVTVARELIGKILVYKPNEQTLSGIIVETEAYTGKNDPASHSFKGKTKRNEVMFDEGGKVYVYFTYGNHYCFNVVTGKKHQGNAVLIRALQPLEGILIMKKNRDTDSIHNLASGPGKLTQAFGINKNLYGADLTGKKIFIIESQGSNIIKVRKSKRIGISKNADKLYRFYAADNPYVSKANVSKSIKYDKS